MAVPFDFKNVAKMAKSLSDTLRSVEEYRDDFWDDEILGPMLEVYALLTHFPDKALPKDSSDDHVAACRAYAFAWIARVHAKRDGCDCLEVDELDNLLAELDSVGGPQTIEALKSGAADANRKYASLRKSSKLKQLGH